MLQDSSGNLPLADEPGIVDELLETFRGRHRLILVSGLVKMIAAGLVFYFCIYQFFQQESTMAMLAYATATIICLVVAATSMLFLWIQMNHNTTAREIKRVDLRCAMILRAIEAQNAHQSVNAGETIS